MGHIRLALNGGAGVERQIAYAPGVAQQALILRNGSRWRASLRHVPVKQQRKSANFGGMEPVAGRRRRAVHAASLKDTLPSQRGAIRDATPRPQPYTFLYRIFDDVSDLADFQGADVLLIGSPRSPNCHNVRINPGKGEEITALGNYQRDPLGSIPQPVRPAEPEPLSDAYSTAYALPAGRRLAFWLLQEPQNKSAS